MGSRRSLSNRGFIWTSMGVAQVLICFFIVTTLVSLPVTSYTHDLYRRRPHHGCDCSHSCPARFTCPGEGCNCVSNTYCDDVNLFCDHIPCDVGQVGTCISNKCTCVQEDYCNNCYAACRGHPFTCGAHNHCHCHNPDTCDSSHSGPVCLSSECGGTRKCVESRCHCDYHCSGVADCRNFPCKFGTPTCVDKMCSCNDPCHKCASECHDKYTCVEGHHHHVTCTCHSNTYCDHNVHCTEKCPYGGQNLCLGNTCTCHCQHDSECNGCPDLGVCHQNQCRCTVSTTTTTTTTTSTTTPRPTTTAATTAATTTTTTAATTTTAPQTSTPSGVACISPRPISSLGPSALGLILESRADTGCDVEKACTTTSDCKNSNYTVSWNPFEFVLCEDPIWRTCTAGYCVCDKTLTTAEVDTGNSLTTPSVSSQGVNCPTCDSTGACTWSRCPESEVCMLRSPDGKLTTHCSIKADCVLIQGLLTSENIQCCEDAGCVNGYFG